MRRKKLALLHTVASLIEPFRTLCYELMPEVDVFNIVDEGVLRKTIEAGGLTPNIHKRVADHVVFAKEAGADAILVTCSSISPCVDVAQYVVDIPVIKIDEAMVEEAVRVGKRIGVIATSPTTLEPTTSLVMAKAREKGKRVSIKSVLCKGAFDAIVSGDTDTHDRLVRKELRDLAREVDVVILAQASMARVVESIEERGRKTPILTSPRFALERTKQLLEEIEE